MNTKPPLPKLPPLRKGITYAFNDYDNYGKPQWLIHDPGRNKFFMIGWKEHEILSRWDLGDPLSIVSAINEDTALEVELTDVENFLEFLNRHFLVQQSATQIKKNADEQNLFKDDNIIHWLIGHYLYFRIPLWHPDKFLSRTKWVGDVLFSRTTGYVVLFLLLIALYQLNMNWETFIHTFPSIFSWQGLFFYFIAFTITKFLHELGHAYMCKRYGVHVPSLGVAFLVFWPVLYTDTTQSWTLNHKKRMYIALAGIWVETYVTIIAALIWANTSNSTIESITYLVITVNWVGSLLINVSPFMRFDGYYVLADYLKMPNLQPRAFALTRWQIRRWLFDWDEDPPEYFPPKLRSFLVAYSLITWVYRLILYLGIALLVYHFFFKILGIILFAIEMHYFILGPIVSEVKVWVYNKDRFSFNRNTKITIFVAVLGILLFFLPITESVRLPATLSYQHQFIYANDFGVLVKALPKSGTKVKANEIIAHISSLELDNNLKKLALEYNKNLSELRRAELDNRYTIQKNVLLSNVNKQVSEYAKLNNSREKLIIKAPFDGIIVDSNSELHVGSYVSKEEWLGDIINPHSMQIEAFIPQIDLARVRVGLEGYFYPYDLSEQKVRVKVISIEALNIDDLRCHFASGQENKNMSPTAIETPCFHASDLGGEIPTYLTEKGEYVPTESEFRVLLQPLEPVQISYIERGTVILATRSTTLAKRVIYRLKSMWIEQSSF